MTDIEKAYNAGYIAALVNAKAHHTEDSIKEQVSDIQDVYNRIHGDLKADLGSDEVD